MREIASMEELGGWVGGEVAVGEWVEITQERIDAFAEATGDHQWIHVDRGRAARESPFGTTIAHGYLTLSLLPMMLHTSVVMRAPLKMTINYGLNKLRYPGPVKSGSRVRNRTSLVSLEDHDRVGMRLAPGGGDRRRNQAGAGGRCGDAVRATLAARSSRHFRVGQYAPRSRGLALQPPMVMCRGEPRKPRFWLFRTSWRRRFFEPLAITLDGDLGGGCPTDLGVDQDQLKKFGFHHRAGLFWKQRK